MAGHAQPLAVLKDPGIGEASEMLVGLAAISALRMIIACNDPGIRVHFYLHIIDAHDARLKLRVREIRQESSPIGHCPIPFRINELIANHARDPVRIADYLRLIPQPLKRHQLSAIRGRP